MPNAMTTQRVLFFFDFAAIAIVELEIKCIFSLRDVIFIRHKAQYGFLSKLFRTSTA